MVHYRVLENEILGSLDDLKYFRVAGELGSFRKAAGPLGVSPQRVKRRIEALEARTNVLLFKRTHSGVVFTKEGQRLFEDLNEFWQSAVVAEKKLAQTGNVLRGEVVVSVTEGLGTFWLTPRIAELIRHNDFLSVFVNADMSPGRPDNGDCDIAISLEKPTVPDLKMRRLGSLHVMPFASPEYLELHGKPKSVQDVLKHRVVEQISEQVPFEDIAKIFGGKPEEGFASIRTNTSSAHFWAVAKGAGIGVMPTYIRAVTRRVVPLDINFKLKRDIWLSYSNEARKIKRVSEAIDFLIDSFDPKKFPWFADEFIHPDDMEEYLSDQTREYAFDGFFEQDPGSDSVQKKHSPVGA